MSEIKEQFIHIRSSIFPILPEENEDNYDDFFYGKSLCQFLERSLPLHGFEVNAYDWEDWGWWVSIKNDIRNIELGVYRFDNSDVGETEFAIRIDLRNAEIFSLKKFKKLSRASDMKDLIDAINLIMKNTDGVTFISIGDEFPL